MFEGPGKISAKEAIPNIADIEEAKEFIAEQWEKGVRPQVSVPVQYEEMLKSGLKPHSTWIPGLEVIAATFGRDPYMPSEEKRIILDIDIPPTQIKPRLTGPDKAFHGVVIIEGPIPPERMTIH